MYVDANLEHDLITGRSVTAVLHLLNQTPVEWFTKRQATVETSTFGSEFVAARTATEQAMDIRMSLRYLGVPIKGKVYMFGDNESVVKNSTVPHSQMKKRHVALSYHRVREAIASGMLIFTHIIGVDNPADILSKHWGFAQVWKELKTLLFWMGETSIIGDEILWKETKSDRDKGELQDSHQDRGEGAAAPTGKSNPVKAQKMER